MSIFKRIRSIVRNSGDRFLPDRLYFRIYKPIYLVGNSDRRGSATRFEVLRTSLYRVSDPDGVGLFFCERTRFGMYLYPKGVRGRISQVAQKYSSAQIRVDAGDIVIDVGANIGEFSRAVSPLASRVLAIDPDPNVQEALALNLQGLSNVSVFQVALSNEDGEADFYLSSKRADSSLVTPWTYSEIVKVRAWSLDTLVREAGIERVDFLKVEAEGWEPEILTGGPRTLAMTRKVAVDAGPERQGVSTTEHVAKTLCDAGFRTFQRGQMVFASRSPPGI